mmetsp:Transcript_6122/g.15922  ORF Transcript_6122/g.15922 Transcript_6122/m.15922 type:complete len:117 (+) Transcript_6122:3-353(+)
MNLYRKIVAAQPDMPATMAQEPADFIRKLLVADPNKRLGAVRTRDVMDHPFLATIDFIALERKEIEPPVKPIIEHPTDDANFEQDYFDGKPAMQVEHWTGVLARYKDQAEVAFRDF